MIATNSLLVSLGQKGAVDFSYCSKVSTGHKMLLCGKDGKKNSEDLSREDCFASADGRNLPLAYSNIFPAEGKLNQLNGMAL